MTAQQIVDIVKIMYDLGATVEYITEGEIGNPDICFYHIIDNINVSQAQVNPLLNNLDIPFGGNPAKLKDKTVYITAYI